MEFEDLIRFFDNARGRGMAFDEVLMPEDCYAILTPEQVAWAEENYHCTIKPVKRRVIPPKETSVHADRTPKEYGIDLLNKNRKRYGTK